ncbi:MAG TPA: methyltransferase domain-containing protein [Allosphingosinicella sp.]|nr:methyltransferase domain-containing protein [Allosphingosinicella sp.]
MASNAFADRYDDIIRHPQMRALYGDSGYFNVGYWVDGIEDQPQACRRLVEEIARAIPADARLILDVGCGVGAATRQLALMFPDAEVVGCNLSAWQLAEAQARGVGRVIEMDAAHMPVASDTVDVVIALESAQHFDTRELFLREAHRVLRPGGTVVVADMLFADREAIGSWMLPAENFVASPSAYANLLNRLGFSHVEVEDVADRTWRPHCAMMRTLSPGHSGRIDAFERSLAHYVLASGRKG